MENVVPGALQRLRAADIIRMAGLASASLGQEYCRTGTVHNTQRQGSRLIGSVDLLHPANPTVAVAASDSTAVPQTDSGLRHYPVEVDLQSLTSWTGSCVCNANTPLLCAHIAALLYQWIARPLTFFVAKEVMPSVSKGSALDLRLKEMATKESGHESVHKLTRAIPSVSLQREATSVGSDLSGILAQVSLSELRTIAREYEIVANGMSKQQLAEAIQATLQQPDAVRRVATTLEKAQRQLLAALTLAGGSMTDADLLGLFERFSLGQPNQLQRLLQVLQSKALLFHSSLHSLPAQHSDPVLDAGWYVPLEVRAALRVLIPVTTFDLEHTDQQHVTFVQSEPYRLLADLLLIARTLDGYHLTSEDKWRTPGSSLPEYAGGVRSVTTPSADGSVPILPPIELAATLLATVSSAVSRTSGFLRFAIELLRLADILHQDDSGQPYLRVLPNTTQLLLGSARAEVLHEFFTLWLTRGSYSDLYVLQEENLRLRCRATSLGVPLQRAGELEMENSEARQALIALLAQAPLNQWISFSAFARFVYRLNPFILQRRQRLFPTPHWWIEQDEGRPLRPSLLSDWLHAEFYYLSHLLSGPLHWWGACDIALAPDGRLQSFRLTPMSGWLFNGIPVAVEETVQSSVALHSALEIMNVTTIHVACSAQTWPIIDLLETFMQPAGVSDERLCYRLTPRAFGLALSRGLRPTVLLELLRSYEGHESEQSTLLEQMRLQIEQWVASYGRIRIYTGVTLLETTDAVVMRELSATTSLDELVVQAINPTLLLLKKTATIRISEDLKRRGQSPLLHDEEFYGSE